MLWDIYPEIPPLWAVHHRIEISVPAIPFCRFSPTGTTENDKIRVARRPVICSHFDPCIPCCSYTPMFFDQRVKL